MGDTHGSLRILVVDDVSLIGGSVGSRISCAAVQAIGQATGIAHRAATPDPV